MIASLHDLLLAKSGHSGMAHDANALNFGLTVGQVSPGVIGDPPASLAFQAIALDTVSATLLRYLFEDFIPRIHPQPFLIRRSAARPG
jgi:hypothetical protein